MTIHNLGGFKKIEDLIVHKLTAFEKEKTSFAALFDLMSSERENVLDTLPLVRVDSRLGWEASMEYTTDETGLEWKLRQLDYELNFKIPTYRKANGLQA